MSDTDPNRVPCPFCAPHRAAGYQPTTCEDCCGSGFLTPWTPAAVVKAAARPVEHWRYESALTERDEAIKLLKRTMAHIAAPRSTRDQLWHIEGEQLAVDTRKFLAAMEA